MPAPRTGLRRLPPHGWLGLGLVGGGIFGWFGVSWMLGYGVRTRPIFFIGLILRFRSLRQ